MPDSSIGVFDSSAVSQNVDVRTNAGGDMRQVVVLGDQTAIDSVADVRGADPASNAEGLVVRDPNTTFVVSGLNSVRVRDIVDGSIVVRSITASIAAHILSTGGTLQVQLDPGHTLGNIGTVTSITNTVAVYFDRGKPTVFSDAYHTSVVGLAGGSVAGSTSGVSVSGVTLVSPTSNYNIKVYAFSLSTTAQAHVTSKFTQGSGGSPTTLWQVGLQAPSQGIAGEALAVTPPGFLFASGVSNTLSLVLDTASLVHYSISYFKESA